MERPNDCPKRTCPMDTREFIERMKGIEDRLDGHDKRFEDDVRIRHERNAAIAEVIDEERIERMKLTDEMAELKTMHKELLQVLRGTEWNKGLLAINSDLETRVKAIENALMKDELTRKAYTRGIVILGTVLGAIGGAITSFATFWFKFNQP